mgnify:FL=1
MTLCTRTLLAIRAVIRLYTQPRNQARSHLEQGPAVLRCPPGRSDCVCWSLGHTPACLQHHHPPALCPDMQLQLHAPRELGSAVTPPHYPLSPHLPLQWCLDWGVWIALSLGPAAHCFCRCWALPLPLLLSKLAAAGAAACVGHPSAVAGVAAVLPAAIEGAAGVAAAVLVAQGYCSACELGRPTHSMVVLCWHCWLDCRSLHRQACRAARM